MRKHGNLCYAAITAALVLLLTAALLLRSPGGAPRITTGRQASSEGRSLPAATAAAQTQERININTADLDTLIRLPGIGPVRAEAILADRAENGPFRSLSDLLRVRGIGEGTLKQIKDIICLEDEHENPDH